MYSITQRKKCYFSRNQVTDILQERDGIRIGKKKSGNQRITLGTETIQNMQDLMGLQRPDLEDVCAQCHEPQSQKKNQVDTEQVTSLTWKEEYRHFSHHFRNHTACQTIKALGRDCWKCLVIQGSV